MSSPILDMENINMRLAPSNMGRCGNGRGVHFGGVTMHPLTVGHPITTFIVVKAGKVDVEKIQCWHRDINLSA